MSSVPRRSFAPSRPFGVRSDRIPVPRPYYGARPRVRPVVSPGIGGSSGAMAGALGALGGTLGCLLCLAAIGALGLFACVIALAAYAKQFLTQYKKIEDISGGLVQAQIGLSLLFVSLFYTIICRIQRN
ncbi:unnamed protein product [Rotaria magnacalcarata]|uniref:Uncharacterized protein n=2 Tax=Rotaria magnacalcarata TaxID=392030 RepID=A0A815DIG1_9BILA|nr:unnamed protein product [Rotaria magnacalcarata]